MELDIYPLPASPTTTSWPSMSHAAYPEIVTSDCP